MLFGILIFNFIASYLTSLYVKYERSKLTQVTPSLQRSFVASPKNNAISFSVDKWNKYSLEKLAFFFLVCVLIFVNASITWLFLNSINASGETEGYIMIAFMQFMFIALSGYVIHMYKETNTSAKKYKSLESFEVSVDDNGIYFPFFCFEGIWREIACESEHPFLLVKFSDVKEFSVEPTRGIKRVTPPYYKIKMKDHEEYLYIERKRFYNLEVAFIDAIKSKLPIEIVFNDKLR
jgi:hypothetical protein